MKMKEEEKINQKGKKEINSIKSFLEAWLNNLLFSRNYSKVFIGDMLNSKTIRDQG